MHRDVARYAPASLRVGDVDSTEEEDPDRLEVRQPLRERVARIGRCASTQMRFSVRNARREYGAWQLIRRSKDHRNQLDDDRPGDGRVALVSKQDHCDLIIGDIEV